ncbi:MFS general substrate transporter [Polyporus arcularius HHB13444]|uniref:MFS general substrate transporter n=1 Tax=Polyporus arcularius HHB13444 TaxID=1314778 RepID=A0A5C3NQP0_9APHY|nr:MFS general substrate transporter [Polyporus arcularius HHB13444]
MSNTVAVQFAPSPPSSASSVIGDTPKARGSNDSFFDLEKKNASRGDTGDDDFPEGGLRAWLVVFGVTCGLCATFGFVNTWGIFQAYYETYTLRDQTPSTIAWIGSVQYALVFMPGLIFGRLFDMGYLRLPVALASALLVLCTFLTAQCTEFWHFLLCQGFGIGFASGTVFTAAVGTIPHWFNKKLGLAFGCMAIGSSIGGTIFPIILKNLIEHQTFEWTLRIMGLILLAFLIILNLTIARRLPPKKDLGPFIDWKSFKNPAYSIYTLSLFIGFLGLYTCLTYLSLSGLLNGVNPDLSFYLLSIANASSAIGRLGGGILADRVGPLNILIPSTFIAGVMTYAWPFATTKGPLIAIAVFYGIFSGVFVAIMGQPAVRMGDVADVGRRVGMSLTIMSLGALAGPPISGAILDRAANDFKPVGYYAGTAVMVSVFLMVIARHLLLKKPFGNA